MPTHQTKKGWLTMNLEISAWLGTLLSDSLAVAISRRHDILAIVSVVTLGVFIQAMAMIISDTISIVTRCFVTGMGVMPSCSGTINTTLTSSTKGSPPGSQPAGHIVMIVPIYSSEVASPEVRHTLVSLQKLAI